jgi:membrane peptidoglycan carboxypeptidase
MFNQGYISKEQRDQAQQEVPKINLAGGVFDAPHFVLNVRDWLDDKFGESAVRTGGYKVFTTLDYSKQKIAEAAVNEFGEKFLKDYGANNEALVALDPKTGQILAEVGSRDFNNKEIDGQYNVVTQGFRQPGSSFKPFVYLDAFEKGYTPDTVLYDVKTDFDLGGQIFNPSNATGQEYGLVTMRKALQGSLNIPAVKTLYLVGGEEEGRKIATRFGYHLDPKQTFGLSMVIGGAEMNMLEHANAYNTLANNGTYNPPVSVLRVENDKGEVLYEWHPESKEIVKPDMVALLDNVLSDNNARAYIFPGKNSLTLTDRTVAAKTGTTDNNKDAWTLGYTPSLTAGVWVGNTKPKAMKKGGEFLAGKIWNRFMSEALKGTPVEKFPDPPKKETGLKPVLDGADGGIKIKINSLNGKIATSSTPPNLIEEKTFLPPHDILYYVKKDDPRGPAPTEPDKADEQEPTWEKALQDWVVRRQEKGDFITLEDVPTEFDSSVDPALLPTIEILSPSSTLTSRSIQLSVKATGPRGVSKVEYRIDNLLVGSSSVPPFAVSYYAQNLEKGTHKLQVIASDDQGNQGYKEVTLNLQTDLDPPSIEWSGQQQTELKTSDFPRAFFLTPFRWDSIKEVKIVLLNGSDQKTIHAFTGSDELFSGSLYFTLEQALSPGSYSLKALMTDKNNKVSEKILPLTVK